MLAVILSTLLAACAAVKAAPLVRRAPIIENCYHDFAYSWDDGPYQWHDDINNVFTGLNSRTTFFTNGNNWSCIYDEDNVQALRHSYEQNHQLGHHTWSHAHLTSLTHAQIDDEINRLNDAFIRILGVRPKVLRPPYGEINQDVADYLYTKWGITVVLWSADSEDSDGVHTSEQWSTNFYHNQADNYNGAAMPLSHETYEWSWDALRDGTAAYVKSKGINMVTIAECIDVDPYEVVTGVYGNRDSSWTCDGPYVPLQLPTSTTSTRTSTTSTRSTTTTTSTRSTTTTTSTRSTTTTRSTTSTTSTHSTTSTTSTRSTTSTTPTTSTTSSSPAPTCVSTYTAGVGETCASIGAKYGLSADAILAANTFLNCQDIWQWTPICIPPGGSGTTQPPTTTTTTTTTSSSPAPSCVQTYTSVSGDTCTSIGNKFGLTAAQIQAANTFVTCTDIWAYTPICIPPGGAPATCSQTYYSVSGDTCDSIGAKFGVSGSQIQAWNSFVTCTDIWVGTPLCV